MYDITSTNIDINNKLIIIELYVFSYAKMVEPSIRRLLATLLVSVNAKIGRIVTFFLVFCKMV